MARLKTADLKPKKQILDNDASEKYKETIKKEVGGYELIVKAHNYY